MIEKKIEALKGRITYELAGEKHIVQGVTLSFDEGQGAILEWSGPEHRIQTLENVQGEFVFKVFFPSLTIVHNQIDSGGSHYRARGKTIYTSWENADPSEAQTQSLLLTVPYLHEYIDKPAPSWKQPDRSTLEFHWSNTVIPLGVLPLSGLSVTLRIEAIADNNLLNLTPLPRVELTFKDRVALLNAQEKALLVREFFEVLMYTSNMAPQVNFSVAQDRVIFRESVENRSLNASGKHILGLPYALCNKELPNMLENWQNHVGKSRAASNLNRLVRHAGLPADTRYFMAFAALGYLNVERTPGMRHKAKVPEIAHLESFLNWWRILLPYASDVEIGKYLQRVANTRHDIAHLSRPKHDVLSTEADLLRGYNHLHVIARACLFEQLGLHVDKCETYLTKFGKYIQERLGEVPNQLLS